MCKLDKDELCNEIYKFKRLRDEEIKPIQEEYQEYIDDTIFQKLPFQYGDIIKDKLNNQIRYFIYKGIKKEYMVLYGCNEKGIENNEDRQYHWSVYEEFEIHREVE